LERKFDFGANLSPITSGSTNSIDINNREHDLDVSQTQTQIVLVIV